MAQLTWNDIGEAATRDHERSRSILLIRPQAEKLMTSTTNEYYQRAKKRRWNGKRRVRRIIANLSRKRKRDRTYYHHAIAFIKAKILIWLKGSERTVHFTRKSDREASQSNHIGLSEFVISPEKGIISKIENEPGITVNDRDGNSDVCTITLPFDIQPSDTPSPWIICRILEVVGIFVMDTKD
ncbi:15751_t:CDS:2, partial [Acaulospora morrowiae]